MLALIVLIILLAMCFMFNYLLYRFKIKPCQLQLIEKDTLLNQTLKKEVELQNEIKFLEEKLTNIFKDPITDLFGFNLFEDRLEQALKESTRYQLIMAVFLIDITNFKMITQAMGKKAGDEILKEIAKRLLACIRKVDSVSRFTENIFAVLLTQLAKKESAAIIAQRIIQAMTEPFILANQEIYIQIGIGIAVYPGDGEDNASLLRNAEYALQLIKENDKNYYQFYQKELYINSLNDLSISTSFNKGTIFKELLFLYQPVKDMRNNKIIAMSLSLLWPQNNGDAIEEKEIFRLASQQRKLVRLTEWMIEKAINTIKHWHAKGFTLPFILLPLPISPLEDHHFIYKLSQLLQKSACPPSCLAIEVCMMTESDMSTLEKSFKMLKYLGVKIVLRGFGGEAFSLSAFTQLNVDYLNLHPNLIADINHHDKIKAIVKSIAFLAKNLGLDLMASGITQEQDIHILHELGCHILRGEYIGEAIPEDRVLVQYAHCQTI